jgi:homoserine O-acetyltransferase
MYFAIKIFRVVLALTETAERHEFVIPNFRTDSGVTLPHGYEWLIGPDRALDPSDFFLVATELFGNGRSSSPSNTPEPYHGPRFPVMTIRDNVEAVHRLLVEELKVTHLRATIGFSMGAQQAVQRAVSYPEFAGHIVAADAAISGRKPICTSRSGTRASRRHSSRASL